MRTSATSRRASASTACSTGSSARSEYVAGDYSIADMSIWPWISRFEWQTIDMNEYPNVVRWYKAIAARPAVAKGYHVPVKQPGIPNALMRHNLRRSNEINKRDTP